MKNGLWVLALLLSTCNIAHGQETKSPPATDSVQVYKKIETYSEKRKFTKQLHRLLFRSTTTKKRQPRALSINRNHENFQGKIIRKITIETLDPFGYSEIDTARKPKNDLERLGNFVHIKSKQFAIRDWLLIKKNQPLDSLLLKESERLVRSQRYVRRVVITPIAISNNPDSVDVRVRVLDSWSMVPNATISSSRATYKLYDRNFLGLGHTANQVYRRDHVSGNDAYSFLYTVPNIKRTYISSEVQYQMDLDRNYEKRISFSRPFYSPYAKWAAGASALQNFQRDSLPSTTGAQALQSVKYSDWDFWGSYAFLLSNENTQQAKTTRLIMGLGYNIRNFQEYPSMAYDTVNFYRSHKTVLAAFGVSSRQFFEDQYLFNQEIIEDVPIGKTFGIITGAQHKNDRWRLYTGLEASFGGYYSFGFLGAKVEYGTFWNQQKQEQGTVNLDLTHFGNLQHWGSWRVRNFIKFSGSFGINRLQHVSDFLQLEGDKGLIGFDGPYYYGTQRMVLSGQVQTYSPWNLIGFRFNPYFHYNFGILANESYSLKRSPLYSGFGVGLMIINDFLVFNSFQLSLTYYPKMPAHPDGVFKTNSFNNEDFGLMNFEFERPYIATYR